MIKNQVGLIRCTRIVGLTGDWMNLGAGVGLIAPAGIVGGFNTPGTVYFTDIFNGLNTNNGLTPDTPFQTITYALTQCTADNDDYIIVMDAWNEATPIAVNITRVHILGLSNNPITPYPTLTATGDTSIMTITSTCNFVEIAGLSFGGGATMAGIHDAAGTCMAANIHHCTFGHSFAGNTPLHGIWVAANATGISIQYNFFYGAGNTVGGTITADGINWTGAGVSLGGIIAHNWLLGCPGIALNMAARFIGGVIQENMIALDADTAGAGITMGATATGNLIVKNVATFGEAAANNPYLDNGAANANHWAGNMGPDGGLANTPWLLTA